MSKMTSTKRLRTFDYDSTALESQRVKGFRPTYTRGAMVKRPEKLPAEPRVNAGECYHCNLPVMVSKGQIIHFAMIRGEKVPTHKACRKANKR